MIPMAAAAVPMVVWRSVVSEDRGDVVETWERSEDRVLVSAYPQSSSRTQAEDGQVREDLYKLLFALRDGMEVRTGDRLGDAVSPVWHLREVKVSRRHASCVGVRLRWRASS